MYGRQELQVSYASFVTRRRPGLPTSQAKYHKAADIILWSTQTHSGDFFAAYTASCWLYLSLSTVSLHVTSVPFAHYEQNYRIQTAVDKSQVIHEHVNQNDLPFSHINKHHIDQEIKQEKWSITNDKQPSKCEEHV